MSKKLIAGFMAALIALITAISPVLAAPMLSAFPGFLGVPPDLYIVVGTGVAGAEAHVADVVGAVDLATWLAGQSYEKVSVPAARAIEVEGKQKDVDLDTEINSTAVFGSELTWRQLPQLRDITVTFKGKEYRATESLQVPASKVMIKSPTDEADYLYLESPDATVGTPIQYNLTFRKTLEENVSMDYPFVITILGKEFSITDVDAATERFTALVGEKATFSAIDESKTIAGKTITLKSAKGGQWASFVVDGASVAIDVGTTKTVAGIKITVLSARVAEAPAGAVSVEIVAGTETEVTYGSGATEEFPGAKDWKISASFKTNDKLSENDWIAVTYTPEESKDIRLGEKLSLPGDTLDLQFVGTTSTATADVSIKPSGSITVYSSANPDTKVTTGRSLELTSTAKSVFNYPAGSVNEYDKLWLVYNTTDTYVLAYYDAIEGKYLNITGVTTLNNETRIGPVRLVLGEAKLNLTLQRPDYGAAAVPANAGNVTAVIVPTKGDTDITADFRYTDTDYFKLGAKKAEAEDSDIKVGGDNRGTREYDVMTSYGLVVKGVKSEAAADRLTINVPNVDGIKATIAIGKVTGAVVTAAAEYNVVKPIPTPVAILDTEFEEGIHGLKNIIAVGGPAVNRISAMVMNVAFPSYGAASGIPENQGLVKVIDSPYATGKVVMMVAGWEKEHTRAMVDAITKGKLAGINATIARLTDVTTLVVVAG